MPPSAVPQRKFVGKRLFDLRPHVCAQIELLFQLHETARTPGGDFRLELGKQRQRPRQAPQIARTGPARRHAGRQPFEVVGLLQLLAQIPAQDGVPVNSSTASRRALIAAASVSGFDSRSASTRAPIGVTVSSSTSTAGFPRASRAAASQSVRGCGASPRRSTGCEPAAILLQADDVAQRTFLRFLHVLQECARRRARPASFRRGRSRRGSPCRNARAAAADIPARAKLQAGRLLSQHALPLGERSDDRGRQRLIGNQALGRLDAGQFVGQAAAARSGRRRSGRSTAPARPDRAPFLSGQTLAKKLHFAADRATLRRPACRA